jgi:hypothetical protein
VRIIAAKGHAFAMALRDELNLKGTKFDCVRATGPTFESPVFSELIECKSECRRAVPTFCDNLLLALKLFGQLAYASPDSFTKE